MTIRLLVITFALAASPSFAQRAPTKPATPPVTIAPAAPPIAPFPAGAKVAFVNVQAIVQTSAEGKADNA